MWHTLWLDAQRHAYLALLAVVCATAIAVPLGIAAASIASLRGVILAVAAFGRTLPSIAVLMLLLPLFGVGTISAIVALVLLALPPLTINTDLALRNVPAESIDAAKGLGMNRLQRFVRVSVPLALPVFFNGLQTATVEVIASATLATFIGAGGLGDDIVRALQTDDTSLLVWSCVIVAAMAFAAEIGFSQLAARVEVRAS